MFQLIADACQTRRTTPAAIEAALIERGRVSGRRLTGEMLTDLRSGACSVLERGWLRVERAHGLPTADRQRPATSGDRSAYRDAAYESFQLLVELDGRALHDNAGARDRDAERDLDATVDAPRLTLRLTYGMVFRNGCRTARKVGVVLRSRGWTGTTTTCAECDLTATASA